ncbi:MAG: hypothetical protein BIFFINMI_03299 [Phycisphaerae bacterium]|nr:hypothetical protein [Phycisphaerae bacterium]
MNIQEFKSEACPICGHTGWCARRDDGLVLCKRPPSPPEVAGYVYRGLAKDGQTGVYVEIGKERSRQQAGATASPAATPKPAATAPSAPAEDRRAHLATLFSASVAALTPERRATLATELGLPEPALGALSIGWSDSAKHHGDAEVRGAWVLPEYDGQGRLNGVTFRFPAVAVADKTDGSGKPLGTKSAPNGYHRGLTLPVGWKELPDPVVIVEGASDVLAGRAVGINVIGRPSNTGGVEQIAQACRHRQVIILGENDRKPDGRWPGKEGADLVAQRLEATWDRPVPVAFPPDDVKDLREWVRHLVPDWQADDPAVARQTVSAAIAPPPLVLLAKLADKRGRATVKAFRWADGTEGVPIHSDKLHLVEAAARRRFVKAVVKAEPDTDADDLHRRLLALKAPGGSAAKSSAAPSSQSSSPQGPAAQSGAAPLPAEPGAASARLPQVFLPGGSTTILSVGGGLGRLLAATGKHFIRGGATVAIGHDEDGAPILEPLKSSTLASVFETVAQLMCYTKQEGEMVPTPTVCSEQEAKLIQHAPSFQAVLPPIRLLSRCPVLVERDGQLIAISGYDAASGIMAFGEPAVDVPLDEAVALLADMLSDFRFATAADRARALAAVITPALVFGKLLGGRAPVDLGEADASQTGKGYRNKLTAAVYRHYPKTVTQRKGGVGSLEETFSTALVKGHCFISLDNVRGEIDSPAIESFLTEDSYLARVPHQEAIEIDPRRVIVQLTSNRADITTDLANRSSCVRILKQAEGYRFRRYADGDVLDHVRANQSQYLGAVFAVVHAWHQAGKPRTDESRHDFRPWAQTLDWITRNVLGAGPLLDGHRETQIRMATPVLNWLRDVAIAVRNAGCLDQWLRASDLVDLVANASDVEIPGLPDDGDLTDAVVRTKVLQAVGRRMGQCFGAQAARQIDGFQIDRQESFDPENRRTTREYRFGEAQTVCAYAHPAYRRTIGADCPTAVNNDAEQHPVASAASLPAAKCAYGAPIGAPMSAPMKSPVAPNAPMGSVIAMREVQNMSVFRNMHEKGACIGKVMEPIGAIGAPGADPATVAEEDEVLV